MTKAKSIFPFNENLLTVVMTVRDNPGESKTKLYRLLTPYMSAGRVCHIFSELRERGLIEGDDEIYLSRKGMVFASLVVKIKEEWYRAEEDKE